MSTIIKFTLKFLASCEIARRLSNKTPDPTTGTITRVEALDYNFGTDKEPLVNGLLVTTKVEDRAIWQLSGPELSALAEVDHVSRFPQRTKAPKAKKAKKAKAPKATTPKVDGRVIQMSDKKRALRDKLYANIQAGKPEMVEVDVDGTKVMVALSYKESCARHKIPTRTSSNQTHTPVAGVEVTV